MRPAAACGPAIAATPPKPSRMPKTFAGVIRSSAVTKWATISVKIGAVALRMDAAPAPTCTVAWTISAKGRMLLIRPITTKRPRTVGLDG